MNRPTDFIITRLLKVIDDIQDELAKARDDDSIEALRDELHYFKTLVKVNAFMGNQ